MIKTQSDLVYFYLGKVGPILIEYIKTASLRSTITMIQNKKKDVIALKDLVILYEKNHEPVTTCPQNTFSNVLHK